MTAIHHENFLTPLPNVGDLVWTRFPIDERLGDPGPKGRPCLVLAVARAYHSVIVCYGTTKKIDQIYPTEFLVSPQDAEFSETGLSYSTKFDIARTLPIPYSETWFQPAPGNFSNSPVMGHLKINALPSFEKAARAAKLFT